MKVCIIGHTEKNYLPYMDKYIDFFKENNIDYDIICWQREEDVRLHADNEYNFYEPLDGTFLGKVTGYIKYRRYILKLLKKNHYDRLVILTTMTALILKHKLLTKYAGRFLFDFRDYSFEKFGFFKRMIDNIIDRSAITTISSHGFMDFLAPNKKIIINHNISYDFPLGEVSSFEKKQVINIGFVGGVRYFDENAQFITAIKNMFRYQLWYIGKPVPNCDLQSFCEENGVTNVSFAGKFDNSQKHELYKNIDIINSIYGNESLEVTTALPNRLYEACLLKKPIISSKGTFLGELITRYKLGLAIDLETDNVAEMIDDYVNHFIPLEFAANCEEFLDDVKKDEITLHRYLKNFIDENRKTVKNNKEIIKPIEASEADDDAVSLDDGQDAEASEE